MAIEIIYIIYGVGEMKWNSELYDNAQGFVSEYGKELITLIQEK